MTSLKIERMYAFVAKNEDGEGVMAFKIKDGWMPMVGADLKRVESLLPIAEDLSKASGVEFKILQFDNRTDVTEQFKEESPIKTIIRRYIKNNKGATKEEIMKYLNEGLNIVVPEKDIDEILMEK